MAHLVFVQKDVFVKPGIMALSAAVKRAGHRCGIVVVDLENDPVAALCSQSPDVIAFSITSGESLFLKDMVGRLRHHFSGRIICGGVHPTFYPDMLSETSLDAICRGEGDEALPEYLTALDQGLDQSRTLNFWVKSGETIIKNPLRPLVEDLDRLPDPDRDLYPGAYALYQKPGHGLLYQGVVMTGRGCPQACSFCFNQGYKDLYAGLGPLVRRRSVTRIMAEVTALTERDRIRFITFDDDSFTLAPKPWLDDFCDAYARNIGLPFKINSVAGALSEHRVKALKIAGCHAVKIGLESGNQALRTGLLNKTVSDRSIVRAAGLLRQYGIRLQTFNMVGLPGETLDLALETYSLNHAIRPDFVWCSLLNPYPGTAIYRHCVTRGDLNASDAAQPSAYSYFNRSPLRLDPALVRLQKLMFTALVFRLSPRIVRRLVRLPLDRVYRFLFGLGMVLGLARINKTSIIALVVFSWRYLARYNHEP